MYDEVGVDAMLGDVDEDGVAEVVGPDRGDAEVPRAAIIWGFGGIEGEPPTGAATLDDVMGPPTFDGVTLQVVPAAAALPPPPPPIRCCCEAEDCGNGMVGRLGMWLLFPIPI